MFLAENENLGLNNLFLRGTYTQVKTTLTSSALMMRDQAPYYKLTLWSQLVSGETTI